MDLAKKESHPQFQEIIQLVILEPQIRVIQEFLPREGLGFREFQFQVTQDSLVQVIQMGPQDLLQAHHLLPLLGSHLIIEASSHYVVSVESLLLSTPR